jgi:uncharacterized membrane protein
VTDQPLRRVVGLVEEPLRRVEEPLRFLLPHKGMTSAFGDDWFGRLAERLARLFGTPKYIAVQTIVVICWIVFNGYSILVHFDKYPFILLNLAFSTQAAYAAPLILLAQTRQADRDKALAEADAKHREALAQASLERQGIAEKQNEQIQKLLEQNTDLTQETKKLAERIDTLTAELHKHVCQSD